jgi:DNA-binding winged helix-turn-helix (wHTH) protein
MQTENRRAVIHFGEFQLDPQLRALARAGEALKLPAKPFATLEFLIENRYRVVSKSELLEAVWRGRQEINTVEQAVRKIRQVLDDDSEQPRFVQTVVGQGYRFVAEVDYPAAATPAKNTRAPSRRHLLVAAGVAAPIVGVAAFTAFRALQHSGSVARVAANGTSLVAMNAAGRILWTYDAFPEPLADAAPEDAGWRTQIVDLDGDGAPEVLLVAAFSSAPDWPRKIFCFSSAGKLLWEYGLDFNPQFRRPDLNGPWRITDAIVVPGKASSAVWLSASHQTWWPAFVARLSSDGKPEIRYVSSGAIYRIKALRNPIGSYILAAGVNNEYRQAALAVLRQTGSPAASPQTPGSEYECVSGCAAGRPYRFILLPRSEICDASDRPYNEAHRIHDRAPGFSVDVDETAGRDPQGAFYEFTADLEPQRVAYGSNYRAGHERLEKEGRIRHAYKDCPEKTTKAVVRICDERDAWRSVTIPRLRPYA